MSRRSAEIPKILYMSRGVPPGLTGVSTVTRNLVQQFARDEMVLLGYYELGRPPCQWNKHWPRIAYAGVFPVNMRGERWARLLQFPLLIFVALCVLVFERCKVIMVTYPDQYFLLAAYIVSCLTGCPLYTYFHNTFLENHPDSILARWLQPRVFRHARHVFVMSEGMARLYREKYPQLSCSPLRHTFNREIPSFDALPELHTPLRLVFMGNVNPSCSDALGRVAKVVARSDNMNLTLLTATAQHILSRNGLHGDNITVLTPSNEELPERLRDGDILILPHGFNSTFSQEELLTIFPTKTIDYLLSLRPILAFVLPNSFIADFLRENGCALVVDEPTDEALLQGIDRLCHDISLREQLVRNALKTAEQFHASVVAGHLRRVVNLSY